MNSASVWQSVADIGAEAIAVFVTIVCNINIVFRNLNYENSQNYAQKSHRNCTFMNSASVWQSVADIEAEVIAE
jgi:hypothetical protein